MPKFSAYMRGQRGAVGPSGQASLYDGIVDTPNDLPSPSDLDLSSDKNYAYYVLDGDDEHTPHLYILEKSENEWTDLGSIKGPKGDTGDAAGVSTTINVSTTTLSYTSNAFVSITTDPNSPDTSKVFNFNFGIPTGVPAGFSNIQYASASMIDSNLPPNVTVTGINESGNDRKQFNFHFDIPKGEAAGFGEPTISVEKIEPTQQPEAIITAEGESTEKIFNFHFKIPQGYKGDRGDSFAAGEGVSFTTGSEYWNENILTIPRGQEQKVPIFIKNLDDGSIIRDFVFDTESNQIIYEANEPFNGRLYSVVENDRTITVNSVDTVEYGEGSRVDINENSTSSNLLLDFVLERGPQGLTGEIGDPIISVSSVSSTSAPSATIIATTSEIDNSKIFNFHFNIPKGEKGETGDAMSAYEGLSFTENSGYWSETTNILTIPRGNNKKIPLFILNNDKNSIAATFKLDDNNIYHQADSKFNGTIYMVGPSTVEMPNINIGTVNTVDYGEGSNVIIHSNTTDYNVTLDFTLERGPQPLNLMVDKVETTDEPYVSITSAAISATTFYLNFGIPKGEKGDPGQNGITPTIQVEPKINYLNPGEDASVSTSTTENGIKLTFNLPPISTSDWTWGELAGLNKIDLTSASNITGILPVAYGGTGINATSITASYIFAAPTNKKGAPTFRALKADDIKELSFDSLNSNEVLSIEHGGTGNSLGFAPYATEAAKAYKLDALITMYVDLDTLLPIDLIDFSDSEDKVLSVHGILPIEHGGTGTSTSTAAWTKLGGGDIGKLSKVSLTSNITGILPVNYGGTGVNANSITTGYVFAAPANADGKPKFRALTAYDIPSLNYISLSGGNLNGSLIYNISSSWREAGLGQSIIYIKKPAASKYVSLGTIQTNGQGSWTIGNYNNENLLFNYYSKDLLSTTANSYTKQIVFNSDGSINASINADTLKIGSGNQINKVTWGTADVASSLSTGNIYLQYEA